MEAVAHRVSGSAATYEQTYTIYSGTRTPTRRAGDAALPSAEPRGPNGVNSSTTLFRALLLSTIQQSCRLFARIPSEPL